MPPRNPTSKYLAPNALERLFKRLGSRNIQALSHKVRRLSEDYGLTYTDDSGKTQIINLTLRPRLIHEKKRNELWKIIRGLDQAFLKVPKLYWTIPQVRTIFPFTPEEDAWISLMREPGYRPGTIVSRWDSNTAFGTQDWKNGSSFFEVNAVGVGGLWYGPACADIAIESVVPLLKKLDPAFQAAPGHDMRSLLFHRLERQRKLLHRTRGILALVMEKASGSNYVEFIRLAAYLKRHGAEALVAEPTDLQVKKDELFVREKKVDLIYRDTTLEELCGFEKQGANLTALRHGFKSGQILSSLEGEFDHKSVFEVFTDPQYSRYFSSAERKIFKKYILWTRLIRETRTTDAKGKTVDLLPFIRRRRTGLVLKPNRLYGGKGVLFGRETTERQWEKQIESALRDPDGWVVQTFGGLKKKRFFRNYEKSFAEKDLYVVSGCFATEKGLGIVGRMSEGKIVNVAQRGGLTPILTTR